MMDTSEQYIKMLVEAWPDIGKALIEANGIIEDLYYCTKHKCLIEKDEDGCPKCYGKKGNERPCDYDKGGKSWWIIILRQDQLQEMVGDSLYNNIQNAMWSILDDLHGYAFTYNRFKEFIPTSMEQLWLVFMMRRKYSKVWNGEDWNILDA